MVSNKLLCVCVGGGGGGLKPVLRYNNLTLGSDVVHIHIVVRSSTIYALRLSSHQLAYANSLYISNATGLHLP